MVLLLYIRSILRLQLGTDLICTTGERESEVDGVPGKKVVGILVTIVTDLTVVVGFVGDGGLKRFIAIFTPVVKGTLSEISDLVVRPKGEDRVVSISMKGRLS